MNSYDYWTNFSYFDSPKIAEKVVIDYLLKDGNNPYPQDIPDRLVRIGLSALALLGDKEYARTGTRREAGGLLHLYQQQSFQDDLGKRQIEYQDFLQTSPDLSLLPAGSCTTSFTFMLATPYISKDDVALHLLDNPAKKEWVFKLPYVASTQWKGTLHATMVRQLVEWWQGLEKAQQSQRAMRKEFVARRIQLTRLFGTEIESVRQYLAQCGGESLDKWYGRYVRCFLSASGFLAGRLYFYPSFFARLGMEVINPHDRETGAGSQPIYFEVVPKDATGRFTLLYVPFDRIGKDEAETRRQVAADLTLLAEGLQAMFTLYGFGAKTSSGFGLAEDMVEDGNLVLKWPGFVFPQAEDAQVQKPDGEYLKYMDEARQIKPDFLGSGAGGLMSNKEYKEKGQQAGGGSLSEFKAFRRWYEEYGSKWQQIANQEEVSDSDYSEVNFDSLNQLVDTLRRIGGEA